MLLLLRAAMAHHAARSVVRHGAHASVTVASAAVALTPSGSAQIDDLTQEARGNALLVLAERIP